MHSQIQLYVHLHIPYVLEKEKIILKSALHDMKHPVDGGFKIIMVWYGIFHFGHFIGWCTRIASLIPRVFSLHYAIPFFLVVA